MGRPLWPKASCARKLRARKLAALPSQLSAEPGMAFLPLLVCWSFHLTVRPRVLYCLQDRSHDCTVQPHQTRPRFPNRLCPSSVLFLVGPMDSLQQPLPERPLAQPQPLEVVRVWLPETARDMQGRVSGYLCPQRSAWQGCSSTMSRLPRLPNQPALPTPPRSPHEPLPLPAPSLIISIFHLQCDGVFIHAPSLWTFLTLPSSFLLL